MREFITDMTEGIIGLKVKLLLLFSYIIFVPTVLNIFAYSHRQRLLLALIRETSFCNEGHWMQRCMVEQDAETK